MSDLWFPSKFRVPSWYVFAPELVKVDEFKLASIEDFVTTGCSC